VLVHGPLQTQSICMGCEQAVGNNQHCNEICADME
jgi:hypothetical protein